MLELVSPASWRATARLPSERNPTPLPPVFVKRVLHRRATSCGLPCLTGMVPGYRPRRRATIGALTLPRKKGRRIRVDDVDYRYRIDALSTVGLGCCSRCGRAMAGHGEMVLDVVIGLDGAPGQILRVCYPASSEPRSITPATVAELINRALLRGWHPDRSGPELALDVATVWPDQPGLVPTCG